MSKVACLFSTLHIDGSGGANQKAGIKNIGSVLEICSALHVLREVLFKCVVPGTNFPLTNLFSLWVNLFYFSCLITFQNQYKCYCIKHKIQIIFDYLLFMIRL